MIELTDEQIKNTYKIISDYYEKYLKDKGVKLPKLKDKDGDYVKDALILAYLAQDYPNTHSITKGELTEFIRFFYPKTNDVQQARHLGMQKGWFIASGGRDNRDVELGRGEYQLVSLEKTYPAFHGHRIKQTNVVRPTDLYI